MCIRDSTYTECHSRAEIAYELYSKTINIEARTMIDMASRQIIPAVISYTTTLAQSIAAVRQVSAAIDTSVQEALLTRVSALLRQAQDALAALQAAAADTAAMPEGREQAVAFRDRVCTAMTALRAPVDELETLVDERIWPFPTYADLLYRV